MSLQSAADFLKTALTDKGLQEKVRAATEGKTNEERNEGILSLSRSEGFDFTMDELRQMKEKLWKERPLSDAELDHVAGGGQVQAVLQGAGGQVGGRYGNAGFAVLGSGLGAGAGRAIEGGNFWDGFIQGSVAASNQLSAGVNYILSGDWLGL